MSIPNPADPNVSAEQLAALAGSDPSAWPAILQNPNCYPALREWIEAQMPTSPALDQTQQYAGEEFAAAAQQTEVFQPGVPVGQAAGPQYVMPSPDLEPEPKKSFAWVWWVVGAVVLVAVAVGLWWWSPWSGAEDSIADGGTDATTTAPNTNSEGGEPASPGEAAPTGPEEDFSGNGADGASPEAFCSIMGGMGDSISLDDVNMFASVADSFAEAAAVAPPEIKPDIELMAEYMAGVAELSGGDQDSMDLSALENLAGQEEAVTKSSENLEKWIAANCQ